MAEWKRDWYLLRCREKTWATTLKSLGDAGIETCCPMIHSTRRRTDSKNSFRFSISPAFPGYIFTRFNPEEIHTTTILNLPGALDFVRFGKQIVTVQEQHIDALLCAESPVVRSDGDCLECMNVPPDLLRKIINIYACTRATERNRLLFSLLLRTKWLIKGGKMTDAA